MSNLLEMIDTQLLLPLVQQATERSFLQLGKWSVQPIHGGIGEGLGVYRLQGQATDQGEPMNWSLILKVLGETAETTTLSAWNYWRREAYVYQSNLLSALPEGIRAPRCFAVQEQPEGRVLLWLEDVAEAVPVWSLTDYGQVAYDFGRFNGYYFANQGTIPANPWLSQQWLRGWVERSVPFLAQLPQHLNNVWVRRSYPPDVADMLGQIWAKREWYLQLLARLPQTFCHMDAFRRNLFIGETAAGNRETVAIDWSFAGPGAVGEELVALVGASISFLEVDLSDALTLENHAIEGYLAGLNDAGWRGDERQVRLGYAAASSLRYTVGTLASVIPFLLDEQLHPFVEQVFRKPVGELCDYLAEVERQVAGRLVAETHALAQQLGLA